MSLSHQKGITMEQFKTIDEILSSDFAFIPEGYTQKSKSNRVLKSTKIEQAIFDDLYEDTSELADVEERGKQKLKTFDSLVNDVFQSIYGLNPKYIDEKDISELSKKFNKSIIQDLNKDDNFTAIKSVCEGKELPSISATEEFSGKLLKNLDTLMSKATGGKGKVEGLDKIEQDKLELMSELSKLLKKRETIPETQRESIDDRVIKAANRMLAKKEQSDMFSNLIENKMRQNAPYIQSVVSSAAASALDRAKETQYAVMAWGNGDADMKKNSVNMQILKRTAKSDKLRYIARFLGRYKEMLNSKRLSGYKYGTGEKYDIEYGNNISKLLTSELSMLASPEMIPLFLKKYQNKTLKQYRKREPIYKGKGDIIVCLDESSSTYGENNAYGMAIAMVLYEMCKLNNANFALVHFSTETKLDFFPKNTKATAEQVMNCAETFLNGGTDFEKPLEEVISLVHNAKLENPDVVFITDGVCKLPNDFIPVIRNFKEETGMKLTGILLDRGEHFEFSLSEFADVIYRTSELIEDSIVEKLIDDRL